MNKPTNLIIVPAHAAFKETVTSLPENIEEDSNWALQGFQVGEVSYYIEHIDAGLTLLKQLKDSVLIFSGGRTREDVGEWTESASYLAVAETLTGWEWTFLERVLLEEYARDSFENLLFSLHAFKDQFGFLPEHIYVTGWKFKKTRYEQHFEALGINTHKYSYVGVNNPEDLVSAEASEQQTREQFIQYPDGNGGELANKRQKRNPFNVQIPYDSNDKLFS